MFPRFRRVRLRLATHQTASRSHARREQAPRRRDRVRPRAALLLPVVAAAGLVLALRPGDSTRATPPWTWAPLPATAFESLPSLGQPSTSSPDRAAGSVSDGGPDVRPVIVSVRPAPTPARAPKGPTHTVASGDNLWMIARRHSADLAVVLRWNEGVDPGRLVSGQRILVPGGSKMAPLPRTARVASRPASVRPGSVERPAAPRVQDGDHLWPLPIRGTLTRRFSSAHPGIDIAASAGTRVRAIAGGTVVWAGWKDNGGGYVVEIEHPDRMRSTYNHNSKVTVGRGDKVAQGDTIALVGSTGWSTGPHLDLRIRMGGRLIDPLDIY